MDKIEHVLIAGAGAVGLTVADQIFSYSPEAVSILARGERFDRYNTNGLYINDTKVAFALANAEKSLADVGIKTQSGYPDLVIIACKNHHLNAILDDLHNFIGANTLILSLLNGISSEKAIANRYGAEKIPLAMILGTDAQHASEHTTYNFKGTIYFGDEQNESDNGKATAACSEKVRLIAEFFERANISYNTPQNMLRTFWYKFMVNVGINQVSAVLRLPYGPFQNKGEATNISQARELMLSLMREVIAVSKCEGIGKGEGGDLCDADLTSWGITLNGLTPTSRTSMCQDVLAGRKTEVELFAQTVSELGKKHCIATPINDTLYLQLRTIEQSYDL